MDLLSKRVELFIDGTYLWHSMMSLESKLDLAKLPHEIIANLETILPGSFDLKMTRFFGSIPTNVCSYDEWRIKRRSQFFKTLEEKGYYNHISKIDFHGRPFCKKDRNARDPWEPKEKCVDIALATDLIYRGTRDYYDIAVVLTGDRDFTPALHNICSQGKDIVIAAFQESCSHELSQEYPTLWLDPLVKNCVFHSS